MKLFGRRRAPDDQPIDLGARSPQLGMRFKDLLDTHTMEDSGERPWSVVVETIAVLDPPTVIAADDFLQAIADDLGGLYDGWEASVVKMTSLP